MGAGAEFDAIRAVIERLGDQAAGIGDDAAVLDLPRGERIVATVDATIEGVHFRREWLSPRELGARAAAGALSDLAAMAARPLAVLVAVGLPASWRDALPEVMAGVAHVAGDAGARVAGGNVSGADALSLTITALGGAWSVLARDGARAGDRVYVTGRLGGPGAALRAWLAGQEPAPAHRERFTSPVPRIAEARWLASAGASAAVDVSDGLAGDAGHLAAASGATMEIELGRLPLVEGVSALEAAASGEEYELLVTAPVALDTRDFEGRFGIPLTEIGRIASRGEGASVHLLDHGVRVAAPRGHDHLT